ncbi:EAL domain-containing protein [Ectothiorhodospiraceae bacterium WFHF3C12]|nr:EAL domain-containing protein [Ectothiorhodospiraceae bacterium WFHF3C12]
MSDLFGNELPAARERPVYLCTQSSELGASIAFDLRHYGFKARTFVSLDVMGNAARSAPPGSFILDTALFGQDGLDWASAQPLGRIAPVLFLSEQGDFETRLNAARAGSAAFVTRPVSLMTLIYELRHARRDGAGENGRVVMLTDADSALAQRRTALLERGWDCEVVPPDQLLEVSERASPQLILLDADMAQFEPGALLRTIRQIHPLSVVPVLLCTGGDKRALDELVAAEGADGVLGLPVAAEDLEAIVEGRIRRASTLREAFRFIATRDPMTGLQTASQFVEGLSQSLATGAFERTHAGVALAEFTAPDDGTGLVRAADVLRRKLPPFASAARLGDNMLAAAFSVPSERALEAVAKGLRQGMADLGHTAPQIGVAVLDGKAKTVEGALEAARRAYPQSGARTPEAEAVSAASTDLGDFWGSRVQEALRQDRFRLVYQPISSLNGQPSALFEVFVRMLDDDDSDILPREFLPAVQRAGLSAMLDRWIITRAIHVLSEHAGRLDQARLFVKVFPESLSEQNLAGWIIDQARTAGLPADRLVVEIPHRTVVTRAGEVRAFCNALREAGFAVAVENFDPDEAGNELLETLRPDYVKLSPSISDSAHIDRQAQKKVSEVTGHARGLGIATIAAQVQDAVVLSALWQSGVEYIQGYFMQEPADVFAGQEESLG